MKIGFIDHHLNNYHANKFHSLLTGPVGAGEIEICAAYESDPQGDDWCNAHGVPRAASAAEVVAKSDAIIVLAPDHIGDHLELGREALKSGKPTQIDKMLSPSLADAREIVRIARDNATPLMSASSLRFAVEIEELVARLPGPPDDVFARGFGPLRGYGCHTVAPALRLFGSRAKRLIDTGRNGTRLITLDDGTRRAFIEMHEAENQAEISPWQMGALAGKRYEVVTITKYDEFYANLMKEAVKFFKTRQSSISPEEQLLGVAVECAADDSASKGGAWVDLEL